MTISAFEGQRPRLGRGAWVAPSADVMGDVELGDDASVWYGAVLRGDVMPIRVGARTNIQDLTVVHVTSGQFPTTIGDDVTVGHRAILHGCTVDHYCLIGMGAIILDGAHVEPYCLVGAGALVTPGTRIPEGSLVLGAPAKVIRPVTDDDRRAFEASAAHYVELARRHAAST